MKGTNIKGIYRDVLSSNGKTLVDAGWKSNAIVEDYGRFLAALMKKDFTSEDKVGIEYMAVGSGSKDDAEFKSRVTSFFNSGNLDQPYKLGSEDYWVWAKKIDVNNIKYINKEGKEIDTVTNKLKIAVTFGENEPSKESLAFKEFALLGIDKKSNGTFNTDKMFFINYVDHGLITKDKSMELTRTIILTFPIEEAEEVNP
ncbi:hypothetical protein B6U67_03320 [Methanosarcinales archaeon ex4484_138]|nr:MAG: hypothetical protein B6U67_03320 [Methanosarcinales archaeon ex4484_138]